MHRGVFPMLEPGPLTALLGGPQLLESGQLQDHGRDKSLVSSNDHTCLGREGREGSISYNHLLIFSHFCGCDRPDSTLV